MKGQPVLKLLPQTPQNCRWAEPTLFLPTPYWLDAWDMPWTCRHDAQPLLIEPDDCACCAKWEPRARPAPLGVE